MMHCYAPEVLGKLLEFKVSDELVPRKALLALLLDGQRNYDQAAVERILFEGKATSTGRRKRLEIVKQAVEDLFAWKYHRFERKRVGAGESADGGTWLLEIKSCDGLDAGVLGYIERRRRKIIREIRKKHKALQKGGGAAPCTELHGSGKDMQPRCQESSTDGKHDVHTASSPALERERAVLHERHALCHGESVQQDRRKKVHEAKTQDTTLLEFQMQTQRKEKQDQSKGKFLPVFLPEAFKPQVTVRKRDDLVNPRRVTYIKFFERIKPSTYAVVREKLFVRNSLQRIPHVLDYEYDSDLEWEDCEDAEDVESTDESEDADEEFEEEDDMDFVDTESETSPDRKFSPLEISFPELSVAIFYDYKASLNAPLLRYESVPDFLLHKLETGAKECLDIKAFSAAFASEHNIKLRAVQKKIQEMLPTTAT